jgi:hypothetical protein
MRPRAATRSLGNGPKVTPAFQPLHCSDFGVTAFDRLQRYATATPSLSRPVALRHSTFCGRVRGAPPKPCGHPYSPCARESHGGACVRVCSADRSVSPLSPPRPATPRRAACRGDKPPRLRRLIREGCWPVNVSYRPFAGILLRSCDNVPRRAAASLGNAPVTYLPCVGRFDLVGDAAHH